MPVRVITPTAVEEHEAGRDFYVTQSGALMVTNPSGESRYYAVAAYADGDWTFAEQVDQRDEVTA